MGIGAAKSPSMAMLRKIRRSPGVLLRGLASKVLDDPWATGRAEAEVSKISMAPSKIRKRDMVDDYLAKGGDKDTRWVGSRRWRRRKNEC